MEDKSFHLKGSVAAYKKIKYTNQVTSNNGEIDLNIRENCSFKVNFLLLWPWPLAGHLQHNMLFSVHYPYFLIYIHIISYFFSIF